MYLYAPAIHIRKLTLPFSFDDTGFAWKFLGFLIGIRLLVWLLDILYEHAYRDTPNPPARGSKDIIVESIDLVLVSGFLVALLYLRGLRIAPDIAPNYSILLHKYLNLAMLLAPLALVRIVWDLQRIRRRNPGSFTLLIKEENVDSKFFFDIGVVALFTAGISDLAIPLAFRASILVTGITLFVIRYFWLRGSHDAIVAERAALAATAVLEQPITVDEETAATQIVTTDDEAVASEYSFAEEQPETDLEAPLPEEQLITPEEETDARANRRFMVEVLDSAIIAIALVFLLIRPFLLQAFYIPSGSMIPTLQINDKLVAVKCSYWFSGPADGDVVVFHPPLIALQLSYQPFDINKPPEYVKRVMAVAGDRLRIVAGEGVYRNGQKLNEQYIAGNIPMYNYPLEPDGEPAFSYRLNPEISAQILPNIVGEELVVPAGYIFVMGDNRNSSHDSHVWGLLPQKSVIGRAMFKFWPANRIGLVK